MADEIDLAVSCPSEPHGVRSAWGDRASWRWLDWLLETPRLKSYPATDEAFEAAERRLQRFWDEREPREPAEERWVVAELLQCGISNVDLLHGSHVVIDDGGALYVRLQRASARARGSSHYKTVAAQQYEIALPGAGVILFGLDGNGSSWFQLESHSTRGWAFAFHVLDFVRHVAWGFLNIGPLGTSPHSEKRGNEIRLTAVRRAKAANDA